MTAQEEAEQNDRSKKKLDILKIPKVTLPDSQVQLLLPNTLSAATDTIGLSYFDTRYNRVSLIGMTGKIVKRDIGRSNQGSICEIHVGGRFKIEEIDIDSKYSSESNVFSATVLDITEEKSDEEESRETILKDEITALYYKVNKLQHKLFSIQEIFPAGWKRFEKNDYLEELTPQQCSYVLLNHLDIPEIQKQAIISITTTSSRLEYFISFLKEQKHSLEKDLEMIQQSQPQTPSIATQVYRKTAPAIVSVTKVGPRQAVSGKATGFLVSDDGLIVTNEHVVVPSLNVTVTFSGGISLLAQVVKTDDRMDLALLRVNLTEDLSHITPLKLASLGSVSVGQHAVAIGNQGGFEKIITAGIVCGLKYSEENLDRKPIYVISDAIINGGSSGGPLLNERGEVLGINTFTTSQTRGLGFAVWVDFVRALIDTEKHSSEKLSAEIWLYNDGFNKKEHVKKTLTQVFGWNKSKAEDVMMYANNNGKAYCGTFSSKDAVKYERDLQNADLQVIIRAPSIPPNIQTGDDIFVDNKDY